MAYDIGPKIGIDGEAEYRRAISQMTANLKTLASEMDVVTSSFGKNQNSQEALTAQNEVLTKQLEVQRGKLAKLRDGLSQCAEKYGESDEKTLKWKAAVNQAQTAINKLENQLESNNRALEDMERGVEGVGEALEDGSDKALSFGDVLKANVLSDTIVSGIKKLGSGLKNMFQTAFEYNAQMENYTANFTVMLGDAEQAAKKVEELKQFAAKTPFSMGDLSDSTQTLLAFNVSADHSTDILGMLGDIALGDADKLGRLTNAFGKANSTGKLTGETLQQMIEAGFNPALVITQKTGESMEVFQKRLSEGKVSADELAEAMKSATSEGGQFYRGMEQASTTTDGLISTLKDNINAKLGGAFQGITETIRNNLLPAAIEFVNSIDTDRLSENIMSFLDVMHQLTPVIIGATAAMVAYKTASAISGLIDGLRKATESQTIAQVALNAVMNANPFVLVATLIAGVVTALATLYATNEDFRAKVQEVWSAVTDTISGAVNTVNKFFTETLPAAGETALRWFENLPNQLKQIGADIVKGLWEGIKSMAAWIQEKVSGFVDGIVGGVKGALGIKSPSKVFAGIGEYMAEGLGQGFGDQMKSVARNIESAIPIPTIRPQNQDIGSMLSQAVNAMGTAAGANAGTYRVEVPLSINGKEFGRAIIDDLRSVMKSNPEVVSDR